MKIWQITVPGHMEVWFGLCLATKNTYRAGIPTKANVSNNILTGPGGKAGIAGSEAVGRLPPLQKESLGLGA